MGVSAGSGKVTAAITGYVQSQGTKLTIATSSQNANGTYQVYAVPAGKKAKIYYAFCDPSGVYNGTCTADGTTIAYAAQTTSGFTQNVQFNSVNYIELAATKVVNFVVASHTAGTHICVIGYLEESV